MRGEFDRACAAWQAGVPSARPFELVEVEGESYGAGIVFERLVGSTLAQDVESGVLPVGECARLLGELMAKLHEAEVSPSCFEDQRSVFAGYARALANPDIAVLGADEAQVEDVVRALFTPGEITGLAREVTKLSGFDRDAVAEVKNA